MMKPVSLLDISRVTGVNQMTVSRALRGVGQVKPSTRERILAAAKEMGYLNQSNVLFAPAVRRGGGGHFLKVLMPFFENGTAQSKNTQRIVQGMNEWFETFSGGIRALPFQDLQDIVSAWEQERFHGIVLREHLPAGWVKQLRKLGPVVMAFSNDFQLGVDCVYTNEYRSAAMILGHLANRGHRTISWFGITDVHDAPDWVDETTTVDRRTSGVHAVRYAAWAALTVCTPAAKDQPLVLVDRDWNKHSLEDAVEIGLNKILRNKPCPTAIVTATDFMAVALIDRLKARGLRVPEDISVIGYGDIDEAHTHKPLLTSIILPMETIGRAVVELIERRQANPDGEPVSMQFETRLFSGSTVGPAKEI
jgi:DNA-binding LacI/PurR family transcriptional regulator